MERDVPQVRPYSWLDRFCIGMVGVALICCAGIAVGIVFALAIMLGGTQ